MKGVVFTEFMDMAEDSFSLDTVSQMVANTDLPSGCAYTSVGTYDHLEMVALVTELSRLTGVGIPELLTKFGLYLFRQFHEGYPEFFLGVNGAFEFLMNVEGHIHVEVKKLYPEAMLPTFETQILSEDTLQMIYISKRKLADLAEGLIRGCFAHYGEAVDVFREDLSGGEGSKVRFVLTKNKGL